MFIIGFLFTKSIPKFTLLLIEISAVSKILKVRELNPYDKTRNKLRLYFMQCIVYIEFNKNKFKVKAKKVL